MKSKIAFLFLFCLTVFFSCKKDDEPYTPNIWSLVQYHHYHLKGIVIDTLTGMPVANAKVCQFKPYYTDDKYTLSKTTAVGWYSGDYIWSGDVRYVHPLPDSADVFIYAYTTDQQCGRTNVKFGQMIENGLFVMPPLYVKPIGYLKARIKDTSGVSSTFVSCRGNNNIIEPITVQNYSYYFGSVIPAGHMYDTTFICRVYPNSNATLTVSYKVTSPYVNVYSLAPHAVFVPSGDTSFVNIFY